MSLVLCPPCFFLLQEAPWVTLATLKIFQLLLDADLGGACERDLLDALLRRRVDAGGLHLDSASDRSAVSE